MLKTKNVVAIITIIAMLSFVFGSTVIFADSSAEDDGTDTVSFGINIVEGPGTVLAKTISGEVLYTITKSGTYTFDKGAEITLEAIPADRFKKWTGQAVSGNKTENSITLKLDKKNMQIDAHFKEAPTMYTLTTGVEGEGSISPGTQEYEDGTVVAITATPASGWHFKGWKEGEGHFSPVDGSITMDGNKTVIAIFEKDAESEKDPEPEKTMYTLTTGVEGEGSISPDTQQYEEGTVVAITATPASGWHFKGWKEGEGHFSPVDGSITMDGDKTVVAIFAKDTVPISPDSAPSSPEPSDPEPSDPPVQEEIIELPNEEIPEGSIDINADSPSQDEDTITLDSEAIPAGDVLPESLPQTGGIPAGSLYGLGGILTAAGLFLRKKYK